MFNSEQILHTRTSNHWQRIGIKRRAGICAPLFSIYSKDSIGIGEFPDIKILGEWCKQSGFSIIQLLPLNEVGSDFTPYSSISTFALEPMYLKLSELKNVDTEKFSKDILSLKRKFRQRKTRVNYLIKSYKLQILKKIYRETESIDDLQLKAFIDENIFWLTDFALFKVLKKINKGKFWETWNDRDIFIDEKRIAELTEKYKSEIGFIYWTQWQCYEQLKDTKKYLNSIGILLMGDLPFLVSRESADVWSQKKYFHLNLSAGAPPDLYFASGQEWGMPPYNWKEIVKDNFAYIKNKLKYAENFYDMYRIDHFVGLFRVWTVELTAHAETDGLTRRFMPSDESVWEQHGRLVLNEMLSSTTMLPLAEDLGTVPQCSYKVLHEYGIPGIEFQRYRKTSSTDFHFNSNDTFRLNSCALLSTHDSSFFASWWKHEASTIDKALFKMLCLKSGFDKKKTKSLIRLLFMSQKEKSNRLKWKDEINSSELLLNIINPKEEFKNEFRYLYLNSFNEKEKYLNYLGRASEKSELMLNSLQKINESSSIFSIQLLQDYLSADEKLFPVINRLNYRINTPGTVTKKNWNIVLPVYLEELFRLDINDKIKNMLLETNRS